MSSNSTRTTAAAASKMPIPPLNTKAPLRGSAPKSPQKSPHIFAEVKTFYDVGWIFMLVTATVLSALFMAVLPFACITICDTVRVQASAALAAYLWISFTDFEPPLPFHVFRSYFLPLYVAFLCLYQHPNGGDYEQGLEEFQAALHEPLAVFAGGDSTWSAALRLAAMFYMMAFTVVRIAGYIFLKNHSLAPGQKPSILLSSDGAYPSIHGVATYNTIIIRRLLEEEYPVHVITGSPAFETKDLYQIAGAPCTRMPCIFTTVGPQTPLGLPHPIMLTRIFFHFRPHVVHLLEPGSGMNVFLILMCWIYCIPVMISHHTHVMEYRKALSTLPHAVTKYALYINYRILMCLADLHVATTKILFDKAIPGLLSWTWAQVRVPFGNKPLFWITGSNEAFDISHYNADMRHEMSNGNVDAKLIVHVGRFVAEKHIMDYLPVVLKLCERHGDKVQFALVGWGPLLKPFMQTVIDAGHGDRIKAMNTLTGKRLYEAYASADIFFSPSGSETYPIVYLEALRSGCIPIAPSGPEAGGSQHTFTPGVHGFQYPRWDVDKAVDAVEKAMAAGKSLQAAGLEHGRKHAWKNTMDRCLQFYDRVLRGRMLIHTDPVVLSDDEEEEEDV